MRKNNQAADHQGESYLSISCDSEEGELGGKFLYHSLTAYENNVLDASLNIMIFPQNPSLAIDEIHDQL